MTSRVIFPKPITLAVASLAKRTSALVKTLEVVNLGVCKHGYYNISVPVRDENRKNPARVHLHGKYVQRHNIHHVYPVRVHFDLLAPVRGSVQVCSGLDEKRQYSSLAYFQALS